jgi:hypothetical protein
MNYFFQKPQGFLVEKITKQDMEWQHKNSAAS